MKSYIIVILLFLLSCKNKPTKEVKTYPETTQHSAAVVSNNDSAAATEIIEAFSDSTNIGEKGKCKVELIKHRVYNSTYVIVKFYTKGAGNWPIGANNWALANTYLYECNALEDLDTKISDFNNDGLNDMTFISADAARGANEVRRLFIYRDWGPGELVSMVNSESYPNMLYNDELHCIDAFIVTGGCSTVFLKIEGDSLKPFAKVDNNDYRTVFEIDKYGNEKLIRRDTILSSDDIYVRYKNYNPLKEYKDE